MTRASRRYFGFAVLSLLFATAQLRLIVMVLQKHFWESAEAAQGVLDGHPHWRVFRAVCSGRS